MKNIIENIENRICINCNQELSIEHFKKHYYSKVKNRYSYDKMCKQCRSKKDGHEFTQYDTFTDEQVIQCYEDVLNGKRKKYPTQISLNRKDYVIVLIKYLFKEKLKCDSKEKVCEMFNGNTLNKYKFNFHSKLCLTILDLLNITFPEYNIKPWELKYGNIHGMYDSDFNKKECIEWFLNNLMNKNIITKPIDIISRSDIYKLLQDNKLSGLLHKFEDSSIKLLMWYFNTYTEHKINEWNFYVPPRNFWNLENSSRAFKWMLKQIGFNNEWTDDKKKSFIIDNITKDMFETYKIVGAYEFFDNIYNASKFTLNKELFFIWELKYTPNNFWKSKENRNVALKQLIENVLCLNKHDIPKIIKQTVLKDTQYYKFCMPCTLYYNGNFYEWINDIYPNEFTQEDFKISQAKDQTILLSNEELRVYEYLKENITNNIKYIGKYKNTKYSYKFEDTEFRPDFVVENILDKPIIIEHFGYYYENHTNIIFKEYKQKTIKKIQYFNQNKDVYFIALFPEDLSHNFKGILDKWNMLMLNNT